MARDVSLAAAVAVAAAAVAVVAVVGRGRNMLTVPVIQDSVALQTETGRRRFQADPDALGGAEARGLARVGAGLQAVAGSAEEANDALDEADARALDNEYSARLRKELHAPEVGYLNQRGVDAVNARADVESRIDAMAVDVAGRARNGRSGAMATEVLRRRAAAALGQVAEHAAAQTLAYQTEQIETGLNEATDNAVAAYGDEPQWRAQMRTGASLLQRAASLNGWDKATTASRARQFQSDVMGRIIQQLAVADPAAAEDLFNRERPNLSAQEAGELRTTMLAAQTQARQRLAAQIWQDIANGRNPRANAAWREFSSNPLYGPEHIQVNDYLRVRAEREATGASIPANGPAYLGALLEADRDEQAFAEPGALEQYFTEHAGEMRGSEMEALLTRRRAIRNAGGGAETANRQRENFNATLALAALMLRPHHFDPDPPARASGDVHERARAYQAALQREVQDYMAQNGGRAPTGEDVQAVIGRALGAMNASTFRNLPAFRARRAARVEGPSVPALASPVLPYDLIPPTTRRELVNGLRQRFGRDPMQSEVESAYLNLVSGRDLNGRPLRRASP